MNPVEIIKLKRNKYPLQKEHLKYFIEGYLNGAVTDYQMSAFLMAVYFNGMNDEETFLLTEIMLNSGKVVELDFINKPKIDKHSTGGVGDKTSLIIAPVVASCGVCVPMISGRGLGHTGGTLDKLESIPGFNVNLDIKRYREILDKSGVALIGQTSELAPADKKIYALRDVTATIENISLITASIMSKKLAEGAEGIVFDVKIGDGANLPDYESSVQLAKTLLSVSKKSGKKAIAVLTDMTQPLGMKVGNWLEIEECLQIMESGEKVRDLIEISNYLAGAMLYLGDKAASVEEGSEMANEKISDKSAYRKFLEIVREQNGNIEYVKDYKNPKRTEFSKKIISGTDGFISELNANKFGLASVELGCGRKKADDKIDYLAGIILHRKCGEKIKKGDVVCEIFADDEIKINNSGVLLNDAIQVSKEKPKEKKLIIDILN